MPRPELFYEGRGRLRTSSNWEMNRPRYAGGEEQHRSNAHRIAVSARLRTEHAEAVLGVVEGAPLDEACKNFLSR